MSLCTITLWNQKLWELWNRLTRLRIESRKVDPPFKKPRAHFVRSSKFFYISYVSHRIGSEKNFRIDRRRKDWLLEAWPESPELTFRFSDSHSAERYYICDSFPPWIACDWIEARAPVYFEREILMKCFSANELSSWKIRCDSWERETERTMQNVSRLDRRARVLKSRERTVLGTPGLKRHNSGERLKGQKLSHNDVGLCSRRISRVDPVRLARFMCHLATQRGSKKKEENKFVVFRRQKYRSLHYILSNYVNVCKWDIWKNYQNYIKHWQRILKSFERQIGRFFFCTVQWNSSK